jgi:ABC-type nitrate/sulfonate/bicarbonate transport system substrate-binding protein
MRLPRSMSIAVTLASTALLATSLGACSGVGAPAGGGATIRVGVQTIPEDYVWQAKNWGAQYKLRSTNSVSPSAAREVQQLLSGQVDVIDSGSGPALSAVSRNPSKLLVVGLRHSGGQRNELMIPKNSTAKSIEDLKGKKIAVPTGSGGAIAFSLYLKSKKLSSSDFTFVNMEPSAEIQALKEGSIAGAVAWEPTPSFGVTSGAVKVLTDFGSVSTDPAFLITTRTFAKKHKDALVKFLAATKTMDGYIKQHPADAAKMAADQASKGGANASPAAFQRAFSRIDLSPTITAKNLSDLTPVQATMKDSGALSGPVDFKKNVDSSYLSQAEKLQ